MFDQAVQGQSIALTVGPQARFYCCRVILARNDTPIGVLCLHAIMDSLLGCSMFFELTAAFALPFVIAYFLSDLRNLRLSTPDEAVLPSMMLLITTLGLHLLIISCN